MHVNKYTQHRTNLHRKHKIEKDKKKKMNSKKKKKFSIKKTQPKKINGFCEKDWKESIADILVIRRIHFSCSFFFLFYFRERTEKSCAIVRRADESWDEKPTLEIYNSRINCQDLSSVSSSSPGFNRYLFKWTISRI
uniref:Uncharacterized protein n=1 Tax=Amorphochlora amoebiformis TaxID=1561963 RepID=A0A7S0GXX1_9EUKA